MTPPINIDGRNENYSNVTIDGQDVEQITIDGQDVLSTIPDAPSDAIHQYHVDAFNASVGDTLGNWTDAISGDTMIASGSPTLETKNSNKYVRLQSGDTYQTTSSVYPSGNSGAWSIFFLYYDPTSDIDRLGGIDSSALALNDGGYKWINELTVGDKGGSITFNQLDSAAIIYDGSTGKAYAHGNTTAVLSATVSKNLDSQIALGKRQSDGPDSDDLYLREAVFFDVEKTATEYQNFHNNRV